MTHTFMQQITGQTGGRRFLAELAPRLPRMIAVTAVAAFAAFAAIQFIPQTFEARLAVNLPADSEPAAQVDALTDQLHLSEVVARLPPDIIAELRRDGGGVLDTTVLLRKSLKLTAAGDGAHLEISAIAGTPARARAIVEAMADSHAALAGLPPALADAAPQQTSAISSQTTPVVVPSDENTILLLQQRLSLAWEDRIKLENRARRIDALIADGNYAMLALDAENLPGLGRQIDDLATLEVEREKLAVDLLPNHPKMRTIKEEIDQLSADLADGVQQLAGLVVAERDAARRLEDSLRDELAIAAATPASADTSVVTGAIGDPSEPKVTALPRPVRTDLAMAFSGGLALFGQIGFFAFLHRRRQAPEEGEDAEFLEEPEFDDMQVPLAEPVALDPAEHNWLETSPLPDTRIAAAWTIEPPAASPATPPEQPPHPAKTTAVGLDDARIVAVRSRGETGAGARRLLAHYERQGKRVVLVDAASRRRGRAPGISDLSLGLSSFADIIHGSGSYQTALVPWGRQPQFQPGAKSVRILVQALAELYDVVVLTLDSDNLAACAPLAALADVTMDAADVPNAAQRAA